MPLPPGRGAASGLHAVHGTAHLLTAEQLGQLTAMEHEYLPVDMPVRTLQLSQLRVCHVKAAALAVQAAKFQTEPRSRSVASTHLGSHALGFSCAIRIAQ